jgi:hypothetical protein
VDGLFRSGRDAYDVRTRKQKKADWRAQMGKVEQVPGYLRRILVAESAKSFARAIGAVMAYKK